MSCRKMWEIIFWGGDPGFLRWESGLSSVASTAANPLWRNFDTTRGCGSNNVNSLLIIQYHIIWYCDIDHQSDTTDWLSIKQQGFPNFCLRHRHFDYIITNKTQDYQCKTIYHGNFVSKDSKCNCLLCKVTENSTSSFIVWVVFLLQNLVKDLRFNDKNGVLKVIPNVHDLLHKELMQIHVYDSTMYI